MNKVRTEFISELKKSLIDYPELRIGQIISNALGEDPFYMTDGVALAKLKRFKESLKSFNQ